MEGTSPLVSLETLLLAQEGKMKGINKAKIESFQPLQGCRPMNQWNKFSLEINKHDISAGSHRTGRACCRSCKVEDASDSKIKNNKLINKVKQVVAIKSLERLGDHFIG